MASTSKPKILVFYSDSASIPQGAIVKGGSDKNHVAVAAANTDKFVGVCQTIGGVTAIGQKLEVALVGGGAKFKAGGTIAFGDFLTSDGNGNAITSTSTNDHIIGQAMQSAVSGDIFYGEVVASKASNT